MSRPPLIGAAFAAVAATAAVALVVQATSSSSEPAPTAAGPASPVVTSQSPATDPASVAVVSTSSARPSTSAPARPPSSPAGSASAGSSSGSASAAGSSPRSPAVRFTVTAGPVRTSDCASVARYLVARYLASHRCGQVTRQLQGATVAGRPVVVSVARVQFGAAADAAAFVPLVTSDGTGDVVPLRADFTLDPTFLAVASGETVTIAEAMWGDGPTTADDPALLPVVRAAAG